MADYSKLAAIRGKLGDTSAAVLVMAAGEAGALRAEGAPLAKDLVPLLGSVHEGVRKAALNAFQKIGPAAAEELAKGLGNESIQVRRRARLLLLHLGTLASPALSKVASDHAELAGDIRQILEEINKNSLEFETRMDSQDKSKGPSVPAKPTDTPGKEGTRPLERIMQARAPAPASPASRPESGFSAAMKGAVTANNAAREALKAKPAPVPGVKPGAPKAKAKTGP